MNRPLNTTVNMSYDQTLSGSQNIDLDSPIGNIAIGTVFGVGIFTVNIVTLAAIVHYDYVKENYITLIKSMCVADALTGLSLILSVINTSNRITSFMCITHPAMYLYKFISEFPPLVSHWHTVALSIDRLFEVKFALRYHTLMTPKKIMILASATWIIGIIEQTIILILRWDKMCNRDPLHFHLYDVALRVHILMIFVINAAIYSYLWRQARRHRNMIAQVDALQQAPVIDKATIMVIVINVLFAVMWGPYVTIRLIQVFSPHFDMKLYFITITKTLHSCGYVHTIVNNLVYVMMNKSIRKRFVKQFQCRNNTCTT